MTSDTPAQPPSRRRKKAWSPGRLLQKGLMGIAERVDFIALLKRINRSAPGRPWLDLFQSKAPLEGPRQDEIIERAVELALAQLAAQGDHADPREVRAHAEAISCRYDPEAHLEAAAAICTVISHLFEQADPRQPFVSADQRELAHLDLLQQYRRQGLGVVFLCNHSSHVDEFIADVVFQSRFLGLPLFAAGTNMMAIKSLAKLLLNGAYTVQRRGAGRAYLATLYNYCRALSDTGQHQGIFLEAWHGGARSRDGSLRYPRRLVTLRGALDVEGDVVVQPVAISYAAVPEDLSLAARQGGMCWIRGLGLLRSLAYSLLHPKSGLWRGARGLYGRAYCTLPRPRLLSELRELHAQDDAGGLSLDEFTALTAIKDIARAKKVMASQLVARGLMRARRARRAPSDRQEGQPAPRPDLVDAVAQELEGLKEYHQATFGQAPDLEDLINERPLKEVVADGLATLRRRAVLKSLGKDDLGLPRVKSEAGLAYYATHGDRRLYSPQAKENLVVMGAGDWGFALAHLVGSRILEEKRYLNASLTLFDPRPEVAADMGINRNPPGRFEDHRLPKNVFVTSDPPSAFKKATEVVLAAPPEQFATQVRTLLEESEQGLNLMVATNAFEPLSGKLCYWVARDLAAELGRGDVAVYVLGGPLFCEDLVKPRQAAGVLAGPAENLSQLADLFQWPPVSVSTSPDPVGVQLAWVLAQVYSLWGGFLIRVGRILGAAQVGHYMALASAEAIALATALGGQAQTFSAASPAWTASFAALGLSGPVQELGRRLGKESRKAKDLPALALKLCQQEAEAGHKVRAHQELRLAFAAARQKGLDLPILAEAHATLWGERVEGSGF
ncbi:MAG: 1-acyl-sn-glycerol-3-phosphate acyltransferase [Desulfarculus sp.]|nr:1-acyl-sn-glycerol-3-phosphate acyltransferase [Desulfarculus sp.]